MSHFTKQRPINHRRAGPFVAGRQGGPAYLSLIPAWWPNQQQSAKKICDFLKLFILEQLILGPHVYRLVLLIFLLHLDNFRSK